MRFTRTAVAAAAVAVFLPLAAFACEGHEKKQAVKMVSLDEAAKLQKEAKASFVDANTQDTRAKYGVIPGATLLSNSMQYAVSELPKDKDAKLVFYCASARCTSSHKAASMAARAGYTDVNVLAEGIRGWKEAGKPVDLPRS